MLFKFKKINYNLVLIIFCTVIISTVILVNVRNGKIREAFEEQQEEAKVNGETTQEEPKFDFLSKMREGKAEACICTKNEEEHANLLTHMQSVPNQENMEISHWDRKDGVKCVCMNRKTLDISNVDLNSLPAPTWGSGESGVADPGNPDNYVASEDVDGHEAAEAMMAPVGDPATGEQGIEGGTEGGEPSLDALFEQHMAEQQ